MSNALKPLLLPQLVEQRRRADADAALAYSDLPILTPLPLSLSPTLCPTFGSASPSQRTARASVCCTIALPCANHINRSSSCSSTDLASSASSAIPSSSSSIAYVSDRPPSPTQPLPPQPKTTLPDVLEEDSETSSLSATTRTTPASPNTASDCSCDDPCVYRRPSFSPRQQPALLDDYQRVARGCIIDYDDVGFLSDGDVGIRRVPVKRPHLLGRAASGYDTDTELPSPLSNLATRLGSRFPTLSRWRPAGAGILANSTSSPTCQLTFEPAYPDPRSVSMSRTTSSRSSSVSSPVAPASYMMFSQPPPASLSTNSDTAMPYGSSATGNSDEVALGWGSKESLLDDSGEASGTGDPNGTDSTSTARHHYHHRRRRSSLERDRALATTPLLPPLLTECSASTANHSRSASPLQSPTVATTLFGLQTPDLTMAASTLATFTAPHRLRHHLGSKRSASSFRPGDEWSDRLGHANFTITPQPYTPERADANSMRQLRADWDAACVNFTKHIVRTGEHYGRTSKIYALTEAKWAETRSAWRNAYSRTLDRVPPTELPLDHSQANLPRAPRSRARAGSSPPVTYEWARLMDEEFDNGLLPSRMLVAEGKFPALGDEDIVGPMVRAAGAASRCDGRARSEERGFWRNLAGRCRLRR